MSKNLKAQFLYAINQNFKEGIDKHSMKESGDDGVVYKSWGDRNNARDFACNFDNWQKANNLNIRQAKEIRSEHLQAFLNDKARDCTSETIENYQSHAKRLEKALGKTYPTCNTSFASSSNVVTPRGRESTRTITMKKEQFQELDNKIKDSKSDSAKAVRMAGRMGLRVSETVGLQKRDVNITEGKATVTIHKSKGGRSRTLVVTNQESVQLLQEYTSNLENPTDKICDVQSKSVNKYLSRQLETFAWGSEYKDAKTSVHAIRKMVAQEKYDECRESGMDKKESMDSVSEYLGHGKNRYDVLKTYVENPH